MTDFIQGSVAYPLVKQAGQFFKSSFLYFVCRTSERKSATECVRCLKAITNSKFGLKLVLNHETALTILARAIDVKDEVTMLETVRLMAAVCLVPPVG